MKKGGGVLSSVIFYIFYNLLIKSYLSETVLLTTTAQDISTLTQFDILISSI